MGTPISREKPSTFGRLCWTTKNSKAKKWAYVVKLTSRSNRSLRSLGRAKARPLASALGFSWMHSRNTLMATIPVPKLIFAIKTGTRRKKYRVSQAGISYVPTRQLKNSANRSFGVKRMSQRGKVKQRRSEITTWLKEHAVSRLIFLAFGTPRRSIQEWHPICSLGRENIHSQTRAQQVWLYRATRNCKPTNGALAI